MMARRLALAGLCTLMACVGEITPSPTDTHHEVVPGRVLVALTNTVAPPFDRIHRTFVHHGQTWVELEIEPDEAPAEVARTLAKLDGIAAAQPRFYYTPDAVPNDPHYVRQYAHQRTRAELAWGIETGRRDVIVAVIGTGVKLDHPDLVDNAWINTAEIPNKGIDDDDNGYVDDIHGWDFLEGDGDPTPTSPHETAVAGVIGATGNNGVGVVGVAWQTRIMSLRIDYETVSVADAIDYAVANGASVINLSFGSYAVAKYGTDTLVEASLRRAETNGVVTVSTAGNNGVRTLRFPAALPFVIAVAATDNQDRRATFSNYGTWIDVAAPGAQIYTTRHDSYGSVNGTSFAAPYVAGVVALVRSQHPEWSAQDIRDVVCYSGDRLATDRFIGNSRVNVYAAVTSAEPPATFARISEPTAIETQPRGSIVQVHGTAIGRYTLELRRANSASWFTIATGHTTRNGQLGLLVTRDLEPGDYVLRLSAAAGDATDVEEIPLAIDDGFLPGFPVTLSTPAHGTPQVVDLDGDGDLEIVVVGADGIVSAHHHDGTPVAGWPVALGCPSFATPAIGDIDGDGDVEVLVAGADELSEGRVVAWHHDGSIVQGWPVETERTLASVVLADVDRDRDLEVIMVDGGHTSGRIDIRHGNGVSLLGWPVVTSLNFERAPVVGDLDGDGQLEIAVSGFEQEYVFRLDGTTVSGWPQTILGSNMSLAMGDVDGNGALDLLTLERHRAALVEGGATVRPGWPQSMTIGPYSTSALADLTGDGRLEVIVVSTEGEVHAYHRDGTALPGWPKRQLGALSAGVAIADIDEDGRPDVVVTAHDGRIYAWSHRGETVNGFPKRLDDAVGSPPALTDLDGDGRVDLVLLSGARLHALALGRRHDPAVTEWASGRHDTRNSGYYPKRFPLTLTSTAIGTIRLTARTPTDVPHPARYDVFRDRVRIGQTTTGRFVDRDAPRSAVLVYRMIAMDSGAQTLARSQARVIDPVVLFCQSNPVGTACDDENPCTDNDVCDGSRCRGLAAEEGRSCNDENLCTADDVCNAGACVGQRHVECRQGPCLVSICEPITGVCETTEFADTTSCQDSDPCTLDDTCLEGVCIAGHSRRCDPPGPCQSAGVCRAEQGGCSYAALVDGTTCDDGDTCTTGDACGAGQCIGEASAECFQPPVCGSSDQPCEPTPSIIEPSGCGCNATAPIAASSYGWLWFAFALLTARPRRGSTAE